MSAIVIEGAPANEPVELDEVKQHLNLDADTSDDVILATYIQAGREAVESDLSKSLVNKNYRQSEDNFPFNVDPVYSPRSTPPDSRRYASTAWNTAQVIKLRRDPVVLVRKVEYVDSNRAVQTLFPDREWDTWKALTEYVIGNQILDGNGNIQEVAVAAENETGGASMSGGSTPSWATIIGNSTADGDLFWICQGPKSADFIEDKESSPSRIYPLPGLTWPPAFYTPNAVRIHFTAGYGIDGKNVPAQYKLAILMLVAGWYQIREPFSELNLREIPEGIRSLLGPSRYEGRIF